MFTLGAEYLPETTTVSQMTDDGKNFKFAALFILMKLENYLVAFLNAIKTSYDYQIHGLASSILLSSSWKSCQRAASRKAPFS